jgi:Tol biopolymer transport system component
MMPRKFPLILLGCLLAAPLSGAQLVSLNSTGAAAGNGPSYNASLSANGRFVAFQSNATDLVPGGTSGVNIFVRDLLTGTTTLASVNEPPYTGIPEFPHISADGRYVAYQRSTCSYFFCPETDVFVRDLQAATTTLVSVAQDGSPAGGSNPVISADGRHIAFLSYNDNLVPNDFNLTVDVVVRDLNAGVTRLASVNAAGTGSGNGASSSPALSADGRFIAFQSDASDLVAGDNNFVTDIFYRDLQSGPTVLVTANAAGTGISDGLSGPPTISADGSRVAFSSNAKNLVPFANPNRTYQIYVRDLPAGPTRLVSINQDGTALGNSSSGRPYLTPSGSFVAFQSDASDLVAGDFNSSTDVFLRDVDAGVTRLVSVNASGAGSGAGSSELLLPIDNVAGIQVASDDGRFAVFASSAQDLVSGLSYPCNVSPCYQAYLRDLQAGTTQILSATPAGDAAGNQGQSNFYTGGQISADGRIAAFQSPASNLASLPDLNNANDIFSVVAPQAPPPPPAPVPTLSEAGLALLALLMAGLGLRAIRK